MQLAALLAVWAIVRELLAELFTISLLSYVVLYFVENFFPGFVSRVWDVNILLGIIIASGAVTIVSSKTSVESGHPQRSELRIREFIFVAIISIVSGLLILIKMQVLGSVAVPIAVVSSIIIALLLIVFLKDNSSMERH